MVIHRAQQVSSPEKCPYLAAEEFRQEHFFATGLTGDELDELLQKGWRKFGTFYFRPACESCRSCVPVRVDTMAFTPNKGHRKLLRRNADIRIELSPLTFSREIFDIYREHSIARFNKDVSVGEMLENFFTRSCQALQSNYFLDSELVGAGFLDQTSQALSSVYFLFKPDLLKRGLGIFSILKEIEIARSMGLRHYYLGYLVEGNSRMSYKGQFFPQERLCTVTHCWERYEKGKS